MRRQSLLRRLLSRPIDLTIAIVAILAIGTALHTASLHTSEPVAFKHSVFHEQMQAQTVLVKTSHGSGSGVVVHRGNRVFVWTAVHVVSDVSEVTIHQTFRHDGRKAGEQTFNGHVICRLGSTTESGIKGVDAALIWVDAPPDRLAGATWADSTPSVGETVYHVGNLRGDAFDNSLSQGTLAQIGVRPEVPGWPWDLVDQCDAISLPGSSGGPVFDSAGHIIGLLVGGPGNAVSCYVPLRVIYAAAQEANIAWAVYGRGAPPESILQAAKKANAVEPVPDILTLIFGP